MNSLIHVFIDFLELVGLLETFNESFIHYRCATAVCYRDVLLKGSLFL